MLKMIHGWSSQEVVSLEALETSYEILSRSHIAGVNYHFMEIGKPVVSEEILVSHLVTKVTFHEQ